MFALIENNTITQVGELSTLFPNTSNPTAAFAIEQGALEVVEGEQKDQRFYWVTFDSYQITGNTVTRTYVNTPKALEDVTETPEGATEPVTTKGLKSQWIEQTRNVVSNILLKTDWAVIRKMDRGIEIPADIADERAAALTEADAKESAIAACTTVEELMAVVAPVNTIETE